MPPRKDKAVLVHAPTQPSFQRSADLFYHHPPSEHPSLPYHAQMTRILVPKSLYLDLTQYASLLKQATASCKAPPSGPHTSFQPVTGKTMRCDFCNGRNESTLQQCMDCRLHFCHACVMKGKLDSNAKHSMTDDAINKLVWVAPRDGRGTRAKVPADIKPKPIPPHGNTSRHQRNLPNAHSSPVGRQPALAPSYDAFTPSPSGNYVGVVGSRNSPGYNHFQHAPPTAGTFPTQGAYEFPPGHHQYLARIPGGPPGQMYGTFGYGGGPVPLPPLNSHVPHLNTVQPAHNNFYGAGNPMMYPNPPAYFHSGYPQQPQSSHDNFGIRRPQPLHYLDLYPYEQMQGQDPRDAVPRFAAPDYHGTSPRPAFQDFDQHTEVLPRRMHYAPSPSPHHLSFTEHIQDDRRFATHERYGFGPQDGHPIEGSRRSPEKSVQHITNIHISTPCPSEQLDSPPNAGQDERHLGAGEDVGHHLVEPSPYERADAIRQAHLALQGLGSRGNSGREVRSSFATPQTNKARLPTPVPPGVPPRSLPGLGRLRGFPAHHIQPSQPTDLTQGDTALESAGDGLQLQKIAIGAALQNKLSQPPGSPRTAADQERSLRCTEPQTPSPGAQSHVVTEPAASHPLPSLSPSLSEFDDSFVRSDWVLPKRQRPMLKRGRQATPFPSPVREDTPVPGSEVVQEALSSNQTLDRVRRQEGEMAALDMAGAANVLSAVSRAQQSGGLEAREQSETRANEQEIERRRETAASSSSRGGARQLRKRQKM